ncbi:YbfB/YjiJ family MFS transporter [Herbaspirillum sp. AP02]|uniref:YbfB/YjiJ family MFS transporter n=1 Tax=unclassified Herbaspirillum TaxID=2624150 RepID=UPI0015DAC49C|nr:MULTISPECIES: YbfB/YjiJ family MFS transporter [unclassified Herbaspirillum]MBG7621486.1 YbfB/YjiJ family MFS transporter [Herbaspirillum sp. AP02]NZD67035.1 YbfB/YjiJ family MFS transporter [Herbaspirillum sp. AP21]
MRSQNPVGDLTHTTETTHAPHAPSATRAEVWRYIFAGLSASLVSIGLARFGFTPLIPELIHQHWFSTSSVIYLGAANLAGYLIGALIARPIGGRIGNQRALRMMMLLITLTFLACAFPLSLAWYFVWRLLSGVAGGVVMVLVAGTILPHVPPASRGRASGAIFLGLGLGIAATGTLIPLLLGMGLRVTWIGLAVLSTVLSAASWFAWPPVQSHKNAAGTAHPAPRHVTTANWRIKLLFGQYALMAASAVAPMVFLVDYISRGLGMGTEYGALFWVLYGVGAIVGPPLYGWVADKAGAQNGMALFSVVQVAMLVGVYQSDNHLLLGLYTLVIGMFAPGMVPLAVARVHELLPHHPVQQNLVWSRATVFSAALMALAAYGFSALFNLVHGQHRLMFLGAAVMVVIALLAELGRLADPAGTRQAA